MSLSPEARAALLYTACIMPIASISQEMIKTEASVILDRDLTDAPLTQVADQLRDYISDHQKG